MSRSSGLFAWPDQGGADAIFHVLGIPSDVGNSFSSGPRFGPRAVREASLRVAAPPAAGIDAGDLDCIGRVDWHDAIEAIQTEVAGIRASRRIPVLLGGDHAISYSAVAALAGEGPLCVVWFDAHTDMCEWRECEWHNHKQVLRRIARLPHVERILQIGHRGITYFDESSRSDKMTMLTAGQAERTAQASLLAHLPAHMPVYISVDIDVLDPRWAPGTGHPVPGGLSPETLARLAGAIAGQRHVVGVDLMEINPSLDIDGMTALVGAHVLAGIVTSVTRTLEHAAGEARMRA